MCCHRLILVSSPNTQPTPLHDFIKPLQTLYLLANTLISLTIFNLWAFRCSRTVKTHNNLGRHRLRRCVIFTPNTVVPTIDALPSTADYPQQNLILRFQSWLGTFRNHTDISPSFWGIQPLSHFTYMRSLSRRTTWFPTYGQTCTDFHITRGLCQLSPTFQTQTDPTDYKIITNYKINAFTQERYSLLLSLYGLLAPSGHGVNFSYQGH